MRTKLDFDEKLLTIQSYHCCQAKIQYTALVVTIYVVDERKQCEIFGDGIGGIYESKLRGQYLSASTMKRQGH